MEIQFIGRRFLQLEIIILSIKEEECGNGVVLVNFGGLEIRLILQVSMFREMPHQTQQTMEVPPCAQK